MKPRQQPADETSSRGFFYTATLVLTIITTATFNFRGAERSEPDESTGPASQMRRAEVKFSGHRWKHGHRAHATRVDETAESTAIATALQVIKEGELDQQREALLRLAKDIPLRQVGLALSLAPGASSAELEKEFTRALLTRWLETDPSRAANYASSVSSSDQRQALLSFVGAQWAQTNPAAAKIWVSQLPASAGQLVGVTSVATVLAGIDLDEALDFAWSLPEPATRTSALSAAALKATDADSFAALAWVEQWPEQSDRETVWTDIWEQWVRTNPRQAADYAMGSMTKHTSPNSRLEEAVASWAAADGAATAHWVNLQPEAQRDPLVALVSKYWSQREPAAAAMLARTLPPGELQNTTILDVVMHWSGRDVESVASWINLFPEGELRTQAIQRIEAERRFRQRDSSNAEKP